MSTIFSPTFFYLFFPRTGAIVGTYHHLASYVGPIRLPNGFPFIIITQTKQLRLT